MMGPVLKPNIPEKPVGLTVVDGRMPEEMERRLASFGITLIRTQVYTGIADAISFHPDIMLHHIADKRMVYAPGTSAFLLKELTDCGFQLIPGATPLRESYPGDIAYNAARVGNRVFHNLKHMDPVLRQQLEKEGLDLVHVAQGYTKCATAVIGPESIITADRGIASAAEKYGVEVLLLEPDEGILLPGMSCGFIGGACGLIGEERLAVCGDITTLRSGEKIIHHLLKYQIEIVPLSGGPVLDLGSILPLLTL